MGYDLRTGGWRQDPEPGLRTASTRYTCRISDGRCTHVLGVYELDLRALVTEEYIHIGIGSSRCKTSVHSLRKRQ